RDRGDGARPLHGAAHPGAVRWAHLVRVRGGPGEHLHVRAAARGPGAGTTAGCAGGLELTMESPGKRVLVVEDDRFLRRACEACLHQRGFRVLVAADGEEGLRLARAEKPDLVLLDLLMPKLGGLDVL